MKIKDLRKEVELFIKDQREHEVDETVILDKIPSLIEYLTEIKPLEEINSMDQCEKCGGETSTKTVGDESAEVCSSCGWITH